MATGVYLLEIPETEDEKLDFFLEEAMKRVDKVRREKAEKIQNARNRAASLGAGLLLQKMLRDYEKQIPLQEVKRCSMEELLAETDRPASVRYLFGEKGKPEIEGFPLYFSLSHSGKYVICAVSEQKIGADIQKYEKVEERKLAKRFFTGEEYQLLEQSNEEQRQALFFTLWTQKEAYGKLTGQGVLPVLQREPSGVSWAEFSPPEAGYAMAVCTETDKKETQE